MSGDRVLRRARDSPHLDLWMLLAATLPGVGLTVLWGTPISESGKGGKHTIKPLPKNGCGAPPPNDMFPPPSVPALSFSSEETGTDQTNSTFGGLQNCFRSGHSLVRSPPNSHDTFCSPFCRFPTIVGFGKTRGLFRNVHI